MPDKNNSIEKTLTILLHFVSQNQELGTMEISKRLGLHRATVSRILHTLTRFDFLEQNPNTKKFRLGLSAAKLGIALYQQLKSDMLQIAKPYVDELRDKTSETVILEMRSGERIYAAYLAEGLRATRLTLSPGDNMPLHAAAGPRAIMAFCSPEFRERLIATTDLRKLTPNTITDERRLRESLAQIQRQGYAFDNEETFPGIKAVAAPVMNHEGEAVGAVVIAMNSQMIELANNSPLVPAVMGTASKISSRLYYNALEQERSRVAVGH